MPETFSRRQTSRLDGGWCEVRCIGCPPLDNMISRVERNLDEAFDTAYAIRRQEAMAEQAKEVFEETRFETDDLDIRHA